MPADAGPTPRRALLGEGARVLQGAGVDAAWVEAQLLLAHVLGVEWGALLIGSDVDEPARAAFTAALARRAAREPLQHVTGRAPFRWIELEVGPGVFVPRPETEVAVDLAAVDLAAARVVVDLCAGSGALALAVAHEHPRAQVVAVERSPAALAYLRRNVARLARPGRPPVTVVAADLRDDVRAWAGPWVGGADVVLTNPPYVPVGTAVSPEVHADPAEAVFAGDDGLGLVPAVAAAAATLLRPGGRLVVEHDETHAAGVRAILCTAGFEGVVTEHDLTGRDRFAVARAGPSPVPVRDPAGWVRANGTGELTPWE